MDNGVFSLGTFSRDGERFVGAVRADLVWDLSALASMPPVSSALALFEEWDRIEPRLAEAMGSVDPACAVPLEDLRVEAPIVPRQIFCTGANYKKHVAELTAKQPDPASEGLSKEERIARVIAMMEERSRTGIPYAFIKLPSAIAAPYDQIVLPAGAVEPDWELELGVVIGKGGRNINRADALAHVGGYVVANDITARDRVYRADMKAIGTDWLASKNAATFLPLGPWITPARFVPDPQDLRITLKLNGDIMQDESTSDMIFDVARQIEYISSLVRLLPGDIICTGSPAGNGTHYQRFLKPGDVLEGSISGLGTQRLTCVTEGAD